MAAHISVWPSGHSILFDFLAKKEKIARDLNSDHDEFSMEWHEK